jgi:flagellar protein FlbD
LIKLTGLNHKEVIINSDSIEKIEEVPETIITLLNGNKYLVEESADEVIDKVIAFKRRVFNTNCQ